LYRSRLAIVSAESPHTGTPISQTHSHFHVPTNDSDYHGQQKRNSRTGSENHERPTSPLSPVSLKLNGPQGTNMIQTLYYDSVMTINCSDHKPVVGLYALYHTLEEEEQRPHSGSKTHGKSMMERGGCLPCCSLM
jgi:hypothetical protein